MLSLARTRIQVLKPPYSFEYLIIDIFESGKTEWELVTAYTKDWEVGETKFAKLVSLEWSVQVKITMSTTDSSEEDDGGWETG